MSYLANFHHQITGPESGSRWVFIHGLMGFSSNWRRIIAGLENSERVLVYDQRGHGRSFQPPSNYAPEDYAEDLHKITSELGWDKFILVGHSMGARVCMCFAAQFPEKIERLVLEDMGPESDPKGIFYYEKLLENVPTPFANRDEAKNFFQNKFESLMEYNDSPQVLSQFLYSNLTTLTDGSMDWRFSKPGILETIRAGHVRDRWVEVASFRSPTLLVRGELSKVLSREIFEKMVQVNPLIEGVEVKGAGHWVHFDKPAEFLRLLIDFGITKVAVKA